ncbi:MAG: polysaccharide biosynthesis C-terminal domain-containing protein, partial [Clostridia bacterium]|nr:polysaccharide biosynthesis C-terminal domain-containing protein [Clostridia bacterium]
EILTYSLPMIPNALSWWIVNVSDRTIISIFLGVSFNAIYAVSCKFSNILNSVYSIFNMSWQESAALHIDDDDRDEFFTEMINSIFMVFATVSLLIIAFLPFVYNIIIGEKYLSSYNYVPILLYANSWNVLIGLIGGIYVAKKKTKQIASTTIVSAVLNIIINLALIHFIGLYAACISTLLSYMIMSIYRYIDCQKYVKLRLNFVKITVYTVIFVASSLIYLKGNYWLYSADAVFVLVYAYFINKKMIHSFLKSAKAKIAKFKKS